MSRIRTMLIWGCVMVIQVGCVWAEAEGRDPMLPRTTLPITYRIDYRHITTDNLTMSSSASFHVSLYRNASYLLYWRL